MNPLIPSLHVLRRLRPFQPLPPGTQLIMWTPAEIDLVKREYGRVPTDGLARRLLLRHSVDAIRRLAKELGLTHQIRWTPGQDETLRQHWGNIKTSILAQRIGKSPSALKQRARRLGLSAEREYTPEEIQFLRDHYATLTAAQIGEWINRTVPAVFRLAYKLGLTKSHRHSADVLDQVRELHAQGKTCRQIADATGLHFDQIKHLCKRLRLPTNPDTDKGRRSVAKQLQTLGLDSPTQLRTRAFRNYARECGWPDDLRPREVQILNVLAQHGPKTAMELAAAIGMRTDRVNPSNGGGRVLLVGKGRGGTYPASLIRRGLIYYARRYGKRRLPGTYILTPHAIALRETLLKETPPWNTEPSPSPMPAS